METYEERQIRLREEQAEKKRLLKVKFTELTKKLNGLAKNDKDFKHRYNFNNDGRIFVKVKHGKQIWINRDTVGQYRYGLSRSHALRVRTDYYSIGANRLLRDFDSEPVVKALHSKIKLLIPRLEEQAYKDKEAEKVKNNERQRIARAQKKLKRKIETAVSYATVSFYTGSLEADVVIGKLRLSTWDGENYQIDRMSSSSYVSLEIIKPLLMWSMMEDSVDT